MYQLFQHFLLHNITSFRADGHMGSYGHMGIWHMAYGLGIPFRLVRVRVSGNGARHGSGVFFWLMASGLGLGLFFLVFGSWQGAGGAGDFLWGLFLKTRICTDLGTEIHGGFCIVFSVLFSY